MGCDQKLANVFSVYGQRPTQSESLWQLLNSATERSHRQYVKECLCYNKTEFSKTGGGPNLAYWLHFADP